MRIITDDREQSAEAANQVPVHIHPAVQCSLIDSQRSALLLLTEVSYSFCAVTHLISLLNVQCCFLHTSPNSSIHHIHRLFYNFSPCSKLSRSSDHPSGNAQPNLAISLDSVPPIQVSPPVLGQVILHELPQSSVLNIRTGAFEAQAPLSAGIR